MALLGATRADRSPPLFAAGLLGNRDALVSVPPGQAHGAAYLGQSTVLRLADGRLRYLPPGAAEPVTGPPGDPGGLAVAAEERAWLAAGTVPGATGPPGCRPPTAPPWTASPPPWAAPSARVDSGAGGRGP